MKTPETGMHRLAILASGNGTNARRIAEYFREVPDVTVALVLSNVPDAPVLARARELGVEARSFTRSEFYDSVSVIELLKSYEIDFLVLAGFLWLIPEPMLSAWPGRIVNIHPALLPEYGGKGMYGHRVHEAVIRAGERETGITIHYVNERFDAGEIIFSARCPVLPGDTPATLADRVHELEYRHYPEIIHQILKKEG